MGDRREKYETYRREGLKLEVQCDGKFSFEFKRGLVYTGFPCKEGVFCKLQ